ncbi:MAG: hypothetical protein COC06_05220 [Bacteroidales bacterium]|nr:MAG: hypothetical protein COC06_05220 [Bacteroidales bacterium]
MNLKSKLRVTKPLAKIISLVSIIILGFVYQGCEKEELFSQGTYLDVEMTQGVLSESDMEIYKQAVERMDEFVKVKNNKYTTSLKSGVSINISEELFSLLKKQMEHSNLLIKEEGLVLSGKTVRTPIPNEELGSFEIPRLKSGTTESEEGGINQCLYTIYWHGIDITLYISNRTLFYSTTALAAAATVATLAPEPAVSKVVAVCCGLASLSGGALVYEYPNGIIVGIYSPSLAPQVCIPYSLSGQ